MSTNSGNIHPRPLRGSMANVKNTRRRAQVNVVHKGQHGITSFRKSNEVVEKLLWLREYEHN